jgi:prevent-host-death family protein
MATMTATEARAALPEILDRVGQGDEVTITRHGRPVAVVVRPDRLQSRRAERAVADAERLRDLVERGRRSQLRGRPKVDARRADQLVADVRSGRSR